MPGIKIYGNCRCEDIPGRMKETQSGNEHLVIIFDP